ncbi:MAG: PQQ-binding-like beta-propeller repeat protein [Alphaproteobacteria bacterium]|nr:PQQ-binding-like beta-propeller repeat protein [Alphaproteobacteria bacterium]
MMIKGTLKTVTKDTRSDCFSRVAFLSFCVAGCVAGLTLSGCSLFKKDEKVPLAGQRISVLQMQADVESVNAMESEKIFAPPTPLILVDWPQSGVMPAHNPQNLALPSLHESGAQHAQLKRIWDTDIGQGASKALPLLPQPVIVGGRIFALDTDNEVSAYDAANGKKIWDRNIRPKNEKEDVIAGGLAASPTAVFITTGYREMVALNPADGKILWKVRLTSPARAAPTIDGNNLYVMTVDNRLVSLDATDGHLKWEYEGSEETASLVGAASPAASSEIVLAAFSNGDLTALRVENGSVAWSYSLLSLAGRGGMGSSTMPDAAGAPVIDQNLVLGASYGGRVAALDYRSGQTVWQKEVGSGKSLWVSGTRVFMIGASAELIAIGRESGSVLWSLPLDQLSTHEHARNSLLWQGPVMAEGKLILASPDGVLHFVSAENGQKLGEIETGEKLASAPMIAGGTLYLLAEDGTLSAWK